MVMKAFNQFTLDYFDYHWFWGLRVHKTEQAHSLLSDVQGWEHDFEGIKLVIAKQEKIDGYVLLFRFFYWLFNIDGYAADFYKLAAYHVYGEAREDEGKVKAISERVFSSFKTITGKLHSIFRFERTTPFTDDSKQTQAQASAAQESERHVFEVNEEMQSHLAKLGISVSNQEKLEWRTIREAYKARAKETHPDRSGGQHQAFLEVKAAYDELHVLVFSSTANNQEDPIAKEYYQRVERLFAQTAELAVRVNQVGDEFSMIAHDQQRIAHDQQQIAHDQQQIAHDQQRIAQNQDRIHDQLVALTEASEARGRVLAALLLQQEERGRAIERLEAEARSIFSQPLPEPTSQPVQPAVYIPATRRSSSMQFFPEVESSPAEPTQGVRVDLVDMPGTAYH